MSFRYFKSLLLKSMQIDEQIELEQKRPGSNWIRLLKLKKIRLKIKDRLHQLMQRQRYHAPALLPVNAYGASHQKMNLRKGKQS